MRLSFGLDQYNGQPIWPINPQIKITSYSDESDAAWGGYLVHISNSVAKRNLSETEIGCSSTWRELKGTLNVMHSYIDCLKGNTVKHRTDNQNVIRAYSAGRKKVDLHAVVIGIYKLCIESNIHLFPEWVPRSLNQMADLISKDVDREDHMLSPDLFATVDIMWGPQTVVALVLSAPGKFHASVVVSQTQEQSPSMPLQQHGQGIFTGFFHCLFLFQKLLSTLNFQKQMGP